MQTLAEVKCPRCGERNFYFRLKTQTYVCKHCGQIWKEKKENKK